MLKKLLEYDIRSIVKKWRLFAILSLVCAVISGVGLRAFGYLLSPEVSDPWLTVIAIVGFMLAVLCITFIFVSLPIIMVFIYVHYYRSFFSDRGYLTFMIPVERKTLFHSKLICAYIFTGLQILVVLVSCLIVAMLVPATEGIVSLSVFEEIGGAFASAWQRHGALAIIYWSELLFIILGVIALTVNLLLWSVTVLRGGGVGLWMGVLLGGTVVISMLVAAAADGAVSLMADESVAVQNAVVLLSLLIIGAVTAALNILLYFTSLRKLRYKLNLS